MAALYQLTGYYRALIDSTVDYETGEVDESKVPGFQEILKKLDGDLDDKLDGCGKALKMMDAEMLALDAEEKRLYARRKSIENNKKHLRGYMLGCLELAGIPKRKTALFTIYTMPPKKKLEIVDESAIPMGYRKVLGPPPPDNALIKETLESGKEVPGAKLVDGETTLVVR